MKRKNQDFTFEELENALSKDHSSEEVMRALERMDKKGWVQIDLDKGIVKMTVKGKLAFHKESIRRLKKKRFYDAKKKITDRMPDYVID